MTQVPTPAAQPKPSSSAALGTARPGSVGVVTGLRPAWSGARLWGPAFTIRGRAGDNLALHRSLAAVESGQVLVAELSGDLERGHWGELMSIAAQFRGVAGLVIDGAIRDTEAIAARRFPVFHRGTHPLPAGKIILGELQVRITLSGVTIEPGDWIFADADGILIVPRDQVEDVTEAASRIDEKERILAQQLTSGETTMRALALEALDSTP